VSACRRAKQKIVRSRRYADTFPLVRVTAQGRANRKAPVRTEPHPPPAFVPRQSKIDNDNEDENEHDGVARRNADTFPLHPTVAFSFRTPSIPLR
jgi:hypothetical protein